MMLVRVPFCANQCAWSMPIDHINQICYFLYGDLWLDKATDETHYVGNVEPLLLGICVDCFCKQSFPHQQYKIKFDKPFFVIDKMEQDMN